MSVQGGHDEDFVESPADDCMCPICLLVARDPVLTRCGHTLCKSCCGRLKKNNEGVECPVDRNTLRKDDTFPDEKLKRKILQLDVRCREHSSGCSEVVKLQHLENHMETCGYVSVACPNGCNEVMPRSAVAAHDVNLCPKRTVPCEYCSALMFFQELQNHQTIDCRSFPVRCPLCSKELLRHEIQQHLSEQGGDCPKVVIACEYTEIGCQTKCAREFMSAHLTNSMERHVELLRKNNGELKDGMHNLQLKTNSMERHMELLRKNNRELKDGMRDLHLKVDELSLKIEKQRSDDIENIVSFTFEPLQAFTLDFTVPLRGTRTFPLSEDGLALELEASETEIKRTSHPTKSSMYPFLFGRLFGIEVWLKTVRSSSVTFVYELIEQDQLVSKGVLHLKGTKRVKLAHVKRRRSDEHPIILKYKIYPKG